MSTLIRRMFAAAAASSNGPTAETVADPVWLTRATNVHPAPRLAGWRVSHGIGPGSSPPTTPSGTFSRTAARRSWLAEATAQR
jgi:hypothetical protein